VACSCASSELIVVGGCVTREIYGPRSPIDNWPDHLASGALAPCSAPFESTHNSRTTGDHVTDSRSSIAALSDQLADAVAAAGASVVAVHARPRLPSSGVHWKDGVVVTTDGTVRQEEDITVSLPDGKRIPATFVGRDRGTDLAVLRIPTGSLRVAELGDPAVLRPGNLVLALGRLDEGGARAAFGAVSATGGKWRAWKGGEIDRWLQSDLTIYPGFGGGPLVDSTGQIHGINSGALSRPLATTIPVETVNRVVAQLLERGYVPRGWIGAAMQPVRTDEGGGLLLVSIEKDTPAAKAGLLLGDVIVTSFDQLLDVLSGDSVGKKVSLDVVRAGKPRKIEVVIGERPRGRGRR
jgi:S1-C subfamily serine protease